MKNREILMWAIALVLSSVAQFLFGLWVGESIGRHRAETGWYERSEQDR